MNTLRRPLSLSEHSHWMEGGLNRTVTFFRSGFVHLSKAGWAQDEKQFYFRKDWWVPNDLVPSQLQGTSSKGAWRSVALLAWQHSLEEASQAGWKAVVNKSFGEGLKINSSGPDVEAAPYAEATSPVRQGPFLVFFKAGGAPDFPFTVIFCLMVLWCFIRV